MTLSPGGPAQTPETTITPKPVRLADTGEPADPVGVIARLAIGQRVFVRGTEVEVRRLVDEAQAELDRATAPRPQGESS